MLKTKIESLLFVSPKPVTFKSLVNFLGKEGEKTTIKEVEEVVGELKTQYNKEESGIQIVHSEDSVQMVTNPSVGSLIKKYLKEDVTGELTPASLEALTVIAYRSPIAKAELEQIRGVNCSLILRNLLIRGLITVEEDKEKMQSYYHVTTDLLKYLGINSVTELPDYERLHEVQNLESYLEQTEKDVN